MVRSKPKTSISSELEIPNPPGRALIFTSKWHWDCVGSMESQCKAFLSEHGFNSCESHQLPGSMEFPYAVNHVLSKNATVDVVICLGVVVKGETRHFEVILDSVTQGLVATSLKFNIPIINEVLFVDSIDEAQRRSANDEYNKGIEAAVAAIEILNWSRAL